MDTRIQIAIDGPVGSGKSTVARLVARRLGYTYIDTGAMYRALALKAARRGVSWDDAEGMAAVAQESEIALKPSTEEGKTSLVFIDGEDVSQEIRQTEMGQGASKIGAIPGVRRNLVRLQRAIAARGGVVMEGRDIGTVVLSNAECKIFLSGSVEERAKRRFLELQKKGESPVFEEVVEEVKARDHADTTRAESPLKKADDSVEVDTTDMSIEEVVDRIATIARKRISD